MDDEITLVRIASKCQTLQISDQQRSGRDTRLERAAMLGIVESGAGTSDLTHLTARDIYDEGLMTYVHLQGTRDAAGVLGCSAIKALAHCGGDGDTLYGVVSP